MILRCTKKLLAVLGPNRLQDSAPAPDAEGWYANLVWFDRRKCVLLTHARTLFTILETDVSVSDLRSTNRFLAGLIERELVTEACRRTPSAGRARRTSSLPRRPTEASSGA